MLGDLRPFFVGSSTRRLSRAAWSVICSASSVDDVRQAVDSSWLTHRQQAGAAGPAGSAQARQESS